MIVLDRRKKYTLWCYVTNDHSYKYMYVFCIWLINQIHG